MTKDSGNDICLKKDGSLCIILLTKDRSSVDKNMLDQMDNVSQTFTSKISRGINFIFSWLSVADESEFGAVFGQEEYPKLVVLNPGKRKRFLVHEGDINSEGIEKTLNKILGGDARFKAIKGNKLPELKTEYQDLEGVKTDL